MTTRPARSEIDAAERAAIFHEQYGNVFDAPDALPDFVIAAGDFISRIVGSENTDAGMARIVSGLVASCGGEIKTPSEWRTALTDLNWTPSEGPRVVGFKV